jgi:hypothetical protein
MRSAFAACRARFDVASANMGFDDWTHANATPHSGVA